MCRRLCFFMIPALLFMAMSSIAAAQQASRTSPVNLIFDTDMGNDVDDALALGVIHALQSRGECRLLAVTLTKDHRLSAPFVDLVNTFYGRGQIPIGVVKQGPTRKASKFTTLATVRDGGAFRYPHDLLDGNKAPDATSVLRSVLAAQPDGSVTIAQVGFSTNLARLLTSKPDQHSRLNGRELVARKVRLLSAMAGAFQLIGGKPHREYNIVKDIPAAQRLATEWPTPIVFSGFEIGIAVPYPATSIEKDYRYRKHHPLAEAYRLYNPPPHNRPTWDLTSVLWAVRPTHDYFGLSGKGTVTVEDNGLTRFRAAKNGKHRYLKLNQEQKIQVREALVQLSSQPPKGD